jgi:hypothetical protein
VHFFLANEDDECSSSPMKMLVRATLLLVMVGSLSSCFLGKKYEKNNAATVAYLTEKNTAKAQMNVEGLWYSPQWGVVLLNQTPDGKVTGVVDGFLHAKGVVSGKNVYLALTDDDWTEYTVELRRSKWDQLKGYFSSWVPFNTIDQQEVVLEKIVN